MQKIKLASELANYIFLKMIFLKLLLFFCLFCSFCQFAFADLSFFFDDDIVPCKEFSTNNPGSVNGRSDDFFNQCTKTGDVEVAEDCDTTFRKFKCKDHTESEKHYRNSYKSSTGSSNVNLKKSIIVDTDIGFFPDDTTAMAIVHGFANQGIADILAVIASAGYEGIAKNINVINTFFGRSQIAVGVTKSARAYSDSPGSQKWTEFVRTHYQSSINLNSDAQEAISLYRQILSNATDHSVSILAIGHFTNLAQLLETTGDQFSKLNGHSLVRTKVKEVIAMGGHFPSGSEWNIEKDVKSAQLFAANWPTKVTFVGFEVGNVTCGTKHQNSKLNRTNPISAMTYFGFEHYKSYDGCYDAVAVLIAGGEVSKFYCAVYGQIRIASDGSNDWLYSNENKQYSQRYLRIQGDVLKVNSIIATHIDNYLPE